MARSSDQDGNDVYVFQKRPLERLAGGNPTRPVRPASGCVAHAQSRAEQRVTGADAGGSPTAVEPMTALKCSDGGLEYRTCATRFVPMDASKT